MKIGNLVKYRNFKISGRACDTRTGIILEVKINTSGDHRDLNPSCVRVCWDDNEIEIVLEDELETISACW